MLALPSCQAGTELSSAAHSSVGLRTHTESDRSSDFPALLVSAVQSCPEECSWGSGDRESHSLRSHWGLSVLGWALLTQPQCLLQPAPAFQRRSHNQGYTAVLMDRDWTACFLWSSCVTNSNAESNTVKFMCSWNIYTVLALIMVFVPLSGPGTC